jgi:phosphatidylserine/phosphatidylglycerophosphate/cardiolipin synthase-like enzyme
MGRDLHARRLRWARALRHGLAWGSLLACSSPDQRKEGTDASVSIGGSSSQAADDDARADDSLPGSAECGDSVCGFDESCRSCTPDCGVCEPAALLLFTTPLADADVALADETVGALERHLLRDLDAAQESVELAIYDLTRAPILRSLARAARRGVTVRIVTECEHRTGTRARLLRELEESGVPIVHDRSSFGGLADGCPEDGGQMHHKFVIVDRQIVWVGSANLTPTDLNYNHNHMLRLASGRASAEFAREWDELFAGHFGAAKIERAAVRLEVDGVQLELGFSPRRGPAGESTTRGLLLGAVGEATSSIDLALFALTDETVTDALLASPANVRGAVDASQALHSSSRTRSLCGSGASLMVDNLPGKVHHKLGVVDRSIVLGGSANWSLGGFDQNDEAVFVLRDRSLASLAAAEVARVLDAPAHVGARCCFHGAEAYDSASPVCGDAPCVCTNGLDDDFDGQKDDVDSGCQAPFRCTP